MRAIRVSTKAVIAQGGRIALTKNLSPGVASALDGAGCGLADGQTPTVGSPPKDVVWVADVN